MREINKRYLDNKQGVKCLICEDVFNSITNTHLKKHNLTMKNYREKFPYKPMYSKRTLILMSENGKKRKDFFMEIKNKNPNVKKAREKSILLSPIRKKLGLYKRSKENIEKQRKTLRKKVKDGKWYNPISSKEAKIKVSIKAKKRYPFLKIGNDGRFISLNKNYKEEKYGKITYGR